MKALKIFYAAYRPSTEKQVFLQDKGKNLK